MFENRSPTRLELTQPISADKFLSSKVIKQSEIEQSNQFIQSNLPEDEQQSLQSKIEMYLEKIDQKIKSIEEQKIFIQNQLIIELSQLHQDSMNNQKRISTVHKIISLFLSFYGFWRESENLMKGLQSKTQNKKKPDIYDFILDLIENKQEMSGILCCLYPENNDEEKESRGSGSLNSSQFKEYLFITIIQTFNIRMNVISSEVFQWLVINEKLNIIEILLENGRVSASQKKDHYLEMKKQENEMLKWMHQYLIVQKQLYNNEIEFLLNLNDNQLQYLSSKYTQYIIKHERIPTTYLINRTLIKDAVCKQNVPLMSTMINIDRTATLQILHSNRVLTQVKLFFSQPDTFSIGLYFLKKMSQKHQSKNQSSDYLESVLQLLEKPQNDEAFAQQLYNHCLHPIICCLVISKILLKLSQSKNPYSSEMLKLAKFYLDRALLYRDTIFDAREMNLILFKPLFPSDKPLVKALRNEKYCTFFTQFFVHPCITYLLEQKWMSTYGYSRQLLVTLTPMAHFKKHAKIKNSTSKKSSLSFSSFQKSINSTGISSGSRSNSFSFEHQKQNWIIFKDIEISSLSKVCKNNYFYQFIIYNKSVAVRTLFEFIFFLFIFGSTIYTLIQFVQNYNDFIVMDEEFKTMIFNKKLTHKFQQEIAEYKKTNPDPPEFDFKADGSHNIKNTSTHDLCIMILLSYSYGYKPFINYYYEDCIELMKIGILFEETISKTISVCWLIFCIGINVIQKQIYVHLIRKKTDLSIVDLYDLLMFLVCATFLITKHMCIPDGVTGGYTFQYFDYYTNVLKILTCIMVYLLWMRLFVFLIRSQKLGILVKIIILFIKDLMQFIIILIIITVAFGAVNYILYQNKLELYRTFDKAFFNLIAAGFGAFDFKGQDGIQSFILIVFLIFVNVILMNLLIAILNTRYDITMQQSEMEYSLVVYNDYINLRFNSIYACMVSLPPPFNILNFIFGIVAFITKSRTWNRIALKIGYTIVILIPCSVVYIGLSISLIPISYLVFINRVAIYAYSDNMMCARKRSYLYKCSLALFRLLTWIVFGLPYLLLIFIFHDLPLFYKSAFIHNNNKYNFTKNSVLDLRVIRYISLNSNYLHLSKANVLNYLEFRSSLENKKVEKYKKTNIYNFAQHSNMGRPQLINQINSGSKSPQKPKIEQISNDEKHFASALKKFGDCKLKADTENIQLNHLIRAIKYSAIFFKKSKSTSYNLSKLLYIVKKRDQFSVLLQQNSTNFFLNRSFSSHANLSGNNLY